MLQFLADLFATPKTTPTTRRASLSLSVMEDRLTPTVNVDAVMFNPQPDPPTDFTTAQTRTIIVEGGHTDYTTAQTRTFVIEGGHTTNPRGSIAIR